MDKKLYTDEAEIKLVSALKSKDQEAFEFLYERYAAALFGVIKRIVVDPELSEEVLHDAFVKIWENAHSYQPQKGRLFTWMLNITRNLAIDKIRSRNYKEAQKTDKVADNVYIIDHQGHTRQNIEDIGVKELLSALGEDHKLVIDLLYFKGYTQSEIAKEYNIPLGTVKTRTRAAMKQLRKLLKA